MNQLEEDMENLSSWDARPPSALGPAPTDVTHADFFLMDSQDKYIIQDLDREDDE